MTLATWAIVGGYGVMVWQFGVWGLVAGAAHVGVLLLFVRRK